MAAKLSKHDLEHMDEIIAGKYGDWFSAELMRLIAKADRPNKELLRSAFPDHVYAYDAWYVTGEAWERLLNE